MRHAKANRSLLGPDLQVRGCRAPAVGYCCSRCTEHTPNSTNRQWLHLVFLGPLHSGKIPKPWHNQTTGNTSHSWAPSLPTQAREKGQGGDGARRGVPFRGCISGYDAPISSVRKFISWSKERPWGSVSEASTLCSGHDPGVLGLSPASGSLLSEASASPSPSASAPSPAPALALSLSQINKSLKKKQIFSLPL